MGVDVRRGDGSVSVETGHLRLVLDLATLRMDLASQDGSVRLEGARPCAWLGSRAVHASRALLDGHGELRTRHGVATRIHARSRSDGPLELELDIEVGDDWPGIVVELAVRNRGDAALEPTALEPLGCAGGVELGGDGGPPSFYRMGYQSWSPAGRLPLAGRDARRRPGVIGRMHFGPFTPAARRGLHVSDWMGTLERPGGPGVTLGFVTHLTSLGHVLLEHARGHPRALSARVAAEGLPLAPRECLRAERLWVGLDPPGGDGVAEWAARCGSEMEAPVPGSVPSGWCSWYQFFTRVTADDVRRNLELLRPFAGQLETVQIDDGFQAAVGDWLEPDAGFPGGIAPLAREIQGAGFRAGLWLAPFLAARGSKLAAAHPDWLLRTARGRPVWALVHESWPGRWIHALDPTHPEVQAWLRELTESVRGMGFEYLKLDFLYAGALRGARHDPAARSAEAYRLGLGAVRSAAGPDFLLGCGAPLGPSVGLVDAMRVGPDVAPRWRARTLDRLLGLRAAPAASNSIRTSLARSALHQRLWVNDADCVLVRDADTQLEPREVETLAASVALSGGPVVVSDDLERTSPERARLLRRLLPPLGRTPEISSWSGEVPDEVFTRFPHGEVLVLRLAPDGQHPASDLDPARYGVAPPCRVYDVWADRDLGTQEGPFPLAAIPPHGCRLLRLTPLDGGARVVGSSLHVSGGSLETARLRETEAGRATVRLRLPGPRRGRILALPPGSDEPVRVHVAFRDEAELDIVDGGL